MKAVAGVAGGGGVLLRVLVDQAGEQEEERWTSWWHDGEDGRQDGGAGEQKMESLLIKQKLLS